MEPSPKKSRTAEGDPTKCAHAGKPTGRIALVWRFYWGRGRDNEGMLDRFARFVRQLQDEKDVDVWLSESLTDDEKTHGLSIRYLQEVHFDGRCHIHVHNDTDADLRQRHSYFGRDHPVAQAYVEQFGNKGVAWAFHSEVQMHWLAQVEREWKCCYEYIWWIEDDVEWLGPDAQIANIRDLIVQPLLDHADLIAKEMAPVRDKGALATRTPLYKKIFTWPLADQSLSQHGQLKHEDPSLLVESHENPPLKIHEHAIRITPKLLRKLQICSMLEITAGSENSKRELCEWRPTQTVLDELTKDKKTCFGHWPKMPELEDFNTEFKPLPLDLVGSKYEPHPPIGIDQYEHLQDYAHKEIGFPHQGRLYHPVKTIGNAERARPLRQRS